MKTIKEVSKILGVSPSTLYGWVAKRKVPHHRIAGIKFSDADIAAIVDAAKVTVTEQTRERPAPRARLNHIEV